MKKSLPASDFSFDPDELPSEANVLLQTTVVDLADVRPSDVFQVHRKGHFVFSVGGACTCHTPQAVFTMLPNRGVWIPGGVPHKVFHTQGAISGYLFLAPETYDMQTRCCALEVKPYVLSVLEHLAESDPYAYYSDRQMRLLSVVLDEIRNQKRESLITISVPKDSRLRDIFYRILNDPAQSPSLNECAASLHMSARTFARLLQRCTGENFCQWVARIQVFSAGNALAGDLPISWIAHEHGYASPSAFSSMFKKQTGMTPQEYRKLCKVSRDHLW